MSQAYPLHWPFGWPRTAFPSTSKFGDRTVSKAFLGVKHELDLMRATNLVISSNYTLGADPKDKGVCVYFDLKGKTYALPCDKWNAVEDNLWAIAKHIESLRLQERWGVGNIERAFAGYAALPAPKGQRWDQVLGVTFFDTLETVQKAYRKKAQAAHPDNGGSHDEMSRLNLAMAEAEEHFKLREMSRNSS